MLSFPGSYEVGRDATQHSFRELLHFSCGFVGYVKRLMESIALQLQQNTSIIISLLTATSTQTYKPQDRKALFGESFVSAQNISSPILIKSISWITLFRIYQPV